MFETSKESFPEKEKKILEYWKENEIFEKSVEEKSNCPLFSFYDGPPFATGLPHYGHLLAGTIKDVIPRYKTMKGYYVPRRFGWDCHGLPVENEIEKEKRLYGAKAIEKFGIGNFNEECSNIVLRYTKEWKKTVERMGRWVDFECTYRTMDLSFMESVWWVFKRLYEKDLVYEGFKVMPFSAKLGTPLSNFEANLNYKEVDDPSVVVAFEMEDEPDTAILAWTTTPWTLLSNMALSVSPDITYVKIQASENKFILAKDRASHYFKDFEILETYSGKDLAGKRYRPLFPYFKEKKEEGAFRIIPADFVTLEEGTGVVHTAPAFGEDDFYACRKENIPLVCPVDNNGRFTYEIPEYANTFVKDADKEIIRRLKEEKKLLFHSQVHHRYPYCWRSDTPLIYKAVNTWFIAVEKIKKQLLVANEKIFWVPSHIKEGRFGKWLENARDWAVSRNRYWGTPIPIFRSEDGDVKVIGSVEELEEKAKVKIDNLHRHYIDEITFEENGKVYKRIPEVFDCWFESGSMPYAQNHYPFENKKETETGFPADFIAEGLDQTRGWFYTLNVISVALFQKPAFKNVIVNGIILAEDGNKMSKRLKNYPEPDNVINRYGADAVRLFLLHSPAVKAEDLCFSSQGVELVLRQILIPFWNSYHFFATYASIYHWKPFEREEFPHQALDRWILSKLNKLIKDVEEAMDRYELYHAVEPFIHFIDELTNWYIRRSRTRFWADEDSADRREAFETLYTVLLTLTKIAAPFIPFLTEEIYQQLKTPHMPESVHLNSYPIYQENLRDPELEKEMHYVQKAVSLGHALRKEEKIKVRQPLSKVQIAASDPEIGAFFQKQNHLIKEELNVKKVEVLTDEKEFIRIILRPNLPLLGKKYGKKVPKIKRFLENLSDEQIREFLKRKEMQTCIDDEKIQLSAEEVLIDRKVKENIAAMHDEDIAVAYDVALTPDLKEEGLAREIVNKINTMRREQNFEVTDRIRVVFDTNDTVKKCFENYKEYICHEILATDVKFEWCDGRTWDLNGEKADLLIEKA